MTEEYLLDDFCGSPFWDYNLTWNTTFPDFTPCFERTIFVWVPCAFLWVFAALEVIFLKRSLDRLVPWSWINISKMIGSTLLLILIAIDFFYAIQRNSSGEEVFGVEYAAPAILFCTVFLQLIFVFMEKKRGIQSSGYLFMFWFLLVLCGIPEYRSWFLSVVDDPDNINTVSFVLYMVYFPMIVVMLFLNCFADSTPQYVHFSRGERPCPESSSSYLSQILFAWLDPLIWKGYRNPLEQKSLWNLSYENASHYVVSIWDKNFKKSQAKSEKKRSSDNWATHTNNVNIIEMKEKNKKKEGYISILPTMIRTFGPAFGAGALLKLIYDLLQFVSPLILSRLIGFTENIDGNDPEWHGYFYAALMFAAAQFQSLILGQYFMKMFLVGLRIRTGVISAVYRKALKISNSAKKDSTVGEIVNLMSVDAQRFMDLTTYLNMLWSAPLQIGICLYLLFMQLGPSVLAGLGVLIVLIPVNGFIANKTKILQISQMKSKDKRVKMMNEILNGIKVLKLYAWEPSFENQVLDVRSKEIKVLRKAAYLNAGTSFIWSCTPFLVTLVMFATYIYTDPLHILTATKVFTSISLMNILRMPMAMLPFLIVATVQAKVSLQRLNKFLNADELDPTAVSHDSTKRNPISIENGTFAWGHDEETGKPVLKDINVEVEHGALVAVVGTVGAGKSSLCSAILGEMEKQSGIVNIKGNIAYVAQQAWIQNATLESNIVFNKMKEVSQYESCIRACALQADLEMLPGGDQTEIGEKGINLSGGQKQRVSLARAVYADADIYLLDDPLSAVDSHVGKHIFEEVIGPRGVLKHKTRILVTHSVTYLPQVDKIIVLKNGEVTEHGTYSELLSKKGEFQEFLLEYLSEAEDNLDELETIKAQLADNMGREVFKRQISRLSEKRESESESISEADKNAQNLSRGSLRRRSAKISESDKGKEATVTPAAPKAGEKLIEAEKAETGRVSSTVYSYYIRAIGIVSTLLTIMFGILSQASTIGANIWLTAWTNEPLNDDGTQNPQKRDMYLGVYGAFGTGQAIFTCASALIIARATIYASKHLHSVLLNNVLRSPMSFFDITPVGRLVNRFAKDLDTVDVMLPSNLRAWLMCLLSVIATFVAIIIATPIFVVVILPTMVIYYFVQVLYVSTSRQLKRIESVSRSPIYSHFQESIQGATTIRAYGREHQFIKESEDKVDFNQISYFPNVMANRWLAIRLEFIGNLLTFFAALFAVMKRGDISSGLVGFSISYALSVTQTLNWLVRMTSDVETNIVAVERIKEYSETPQEAAWDIPSNKPNKDWPDKGVVHFNKYSTRYREGLDLVVKDIDCQIAPGEKIGIVGRTGAGKSSLTLALFRIIEAAGGNITLDDINISKIGLHDLRSRLTIIPQDPVLFSGTLRMNLDPFELYNDEKVWSALEQSHLKDFVSGLTSGLQYEIAEGGDNLSVGQRQLVCLARALLRKTRVLILDEATAAVDLETDALIQDTIRKVFSECTVLTIAHRLNTIMDSTRVLVLDKGEIKEFDSPDALLKNSNTIFYGMAKDAGLV